MPKIEPGRAARVLCHVRPGPFSEERLITLDTIDGPISGFVGVDELERARDGGWFVKCVVRSVEADVVCVWIRGSFFTTNGLANIPRAQAMAA